MDVCCGDSERDREFFFRVDHRMEFIAVDVLLFDVIPAPCCLWVIQVRWDDGTVFDNSGDAEKFFSDQLLDYPVKQVIEGVQSNAFNEMAVVSNVRVIFKTELSSPEVIFL